jgi:hypothetical protein
VVGHRCHQLGSDGCRGSGTLGGWTT